ncbi:MAG TPA: FAD/NAD(P)-binding protein [Terracidiphilus sp.]
MAETAISNQNQYSLVSLVDELDARKGVLDESTVRQLLIQATLDWPEVAPYVEPRTDTYARHWVVRRENYEVLVLTWSPSQGSVAHDHAGSLCGLKVVKGHLTEQQYEKMPDGRVQRTTATRIGPQEISIDPGLIVHSLANSALNEVLVTVHIYSPPLRDLRSYVIAENLPPRLFLRPARPDARVIAIVGGGFSGLMTLANLIRFGNEAARPLHFILIDRQTSIGDGVAYRTTNARHLLNVPARRMSAWPDMPEDFVTFAQSNDPLVGPDDFLPRKIYGHYLRKTVSDFAEATREHLSAEVMHDEVTHLAPFSSSGWSVKTASGRSIQADLAILAVGHLPPNDPLANTWSGPRVRYVTDPWASLALSSIEPDEPVLLIGSGLTAVDAILTLNRPDRVAPLIAISRRGLIPLPHLRPQRAATGLSGFADECLNSATPMTICQLASILRRHIATASESGGDWQQVIDALRPMIPRLWDRLDVEERSRFLRHLRPFWEIHRHRMAPAVANAIDHLRREKTLEVVAGSMIAATADADGIDVTFSRRGLSAPRTARVSWVVNCTGPGAHNRHGTHPFLRPLLDAGTICNDELGLGLLTDDSGRAIGVSKDARQDLLVAGTLRKATLWESTAVSELRQQAQTIAHTALDALSRDQA